MASLRRASKLPCILVMSSCLETMACKPSFTEPTISMESFSSTTRLLREANMASIWPMRDFKVKMDVAKTMAVINIKPPAMPSIIWCCFLLAFMSCSKLSVAFFMFSPAPTAKLADRVANSADSRANILMPSNSSLSETMAAASCSSCECMPCSSEVGCVLIKRSFTQACPDAHATGHSRF